MGRVTNFNQRKLTRDMARKFGFYYKKDLLAYLRDRNISLNTFKNEVDFGKFIIELKKRERELSLFTHIHTKLKKLNKNINKKAHELGIIKQLQTVKIFIFENCGDEVQKASKDNKVVRDSEGNYYKMRIGPMYITVNNPEIVNFRDRKQFGWKGKENIGRTYKSKESEGEILLQNDEDNESTPWKKTD